MCLNCNKFNFNFCFLLFCTVYEECKKRLSWFACSFQDAENDKKERPLQHQQEVSSKLGEAEDLLKELFLDVDKAKKSNFSQAQEIENEWVERELTRTCAFSKRGYQKEAKRMFRCPAVSSTSMSAGWRTAPSTETSMTRSTMCRCCPSLTGDPCSVKRT